MLRPLEEKDLRRLKKWRNSKKLRPNFREFKPLNDLDQQHWFESLSNSNHIMFAIENGIEILIGCCGLTYIDWKNGNAEISLYIGNNQRKETLYMEESMSLLLEYGFKELRLHRLYSATFEYNKDTVEKKFNFKLEGKHREARFFDGKFHDELLYSILREEYDESISNS